MGNSKYDSVIRGLEGISDWLKGKYQQTHEEDYAFDAETVEDAITILRTQATAMSLRDNPLLVYLALYAPAPENAPDDWYHHGAENLAAWLQFVATAEDRGYYAIPIDAQRETDKRNHEPDQEASRHTV